MIRSRSFGLRQNRSNGFSRPVPEFAESSVVLTSGRGVYSDVLAEFVAGAIIHFAQNLDRQAASQRARIWARAPVREVRGQTLGIVGVGDVGRAAAKLAGCLNMRLLGCTRNPNTAPQGLPIERLDPPERLPDMLPECDYVLLTLPLTSQTRGIIGKAELEAMKSSSVLINIARGAFGPGTSTHSGSARGVDSRCSSGCFRAGTLAAGKPLVGDG